MIVPDVNLLLYAHFTAYQLHDRARSWWEGALRGSEGVGLTDVAIFGFVRIATNRRVFEVPMTVKEAAGTVDGWLAAPPTRILACDQRHIVAAMDLLRALGTGGNLTTDVQLAAYAAEAGATLATADADFARIPGVRWVNPLA